MRTLPKKYIILMAFAGALIFSLSEAKNDGGPPYNTKAPGDKSCSGKEGASPCHSGGRPENSCGGTVSIDFNGGQTKYIPGQIYTVKASISEPGINKFGFQIVCVKNSDDKNAGTITLTDTTRMRMQRPTWGSYQDRFYVMHRIAGTAPVSTNKGEWSFQWKAPATNQGTLTFYATFVAADNNNTPDSGDHVYNTKLAITPVSLSAGNPATATDVSVFPVPASDCVNICLDEHLYTSIKIYDLSGCEMLSSQIKGNSVFQANTSGWNAGVYIIQLYNGSECRYIKFVKN